MSTFNRPLIGITTGSNPDYEEPWKSDEIGQRREYVDAVASAGGVPVLLPMSTDSAVIERLAETMDGFLFAGGDDIDPVWYGEDNRYSQKLDYKRDAFELRLLEQIEKSKKPVLAICRGMQILNVSRGGSLYQDIPAQLEGMEDHKYSDSMRDPAGIAHHLMIEPGTTLISIIKEDVVPTNSRHHQAVRKLGNRLSISAKSNDGIVEAIEDSSHGFMIGIQSHPESMREEVGAVWFRLFNSFIEACKVEQHSVLMHTTVSTDHASGGREEVSIFTS